MLRWTDFSFVMEAPIFGSDDMVTVYQAYCDCGCREDVTVGGTRSSFLDQSSFPFFVSSADL